MIIFVRPLFGSTLSFDVSPDTIFSEWVPQYLDTLSSTIENLPKIKVNEKIYYYSYTKYPKNSEIISSDDVEIYECTTNTRDELLENTRFIHAGKQISQEKTFAQLNIMMETTIHHICGLGSHHHECFTYYTSALYRQLTTKKFYSDEELINTIYNHIFIDKNKVPSLYQLGINFFRSNPAQLTTTKFNLLNVNIQNNLKTLAIDSDKSTTSFDELWEREQQYFGNLITEKIKELNEPDQDKNIETMIKNYFNQKLITGEMGVALHKEFLSKNSQLIRNKIINKTEIINKTSENSSSKDEYSSGSQQSSDDESNFEDTQNSNDESKLSENFNWLNANSSNYQNSIFQNTTQAAYQSPPSSSRVSRRETDPLIENDDSDNASNENKSCCCLVM